MVLEILALDDNPVRQERRVVPDAPDERRSPLLQPRQSEKVAPRLGRHTVINAYYRFDGCRLASDTNGEIEINGSLLDQSLERSGSRFDTSEHLHQWSDLALTDDSDIVLRIDGETVIYDENSYGPTADRRVSLTLFEERTAGRETLRMSDVSVLVRTSIRNGGAIEQYSLDAEGAISDASAGSVPVAISSPTPLTRARYLGSDPDFAEYIDAQPFTGEINLHADDGRYVTVLARDTDTEEFYVDLTSVMADGTSTASMNVPFATITIYPPTDDRAVDRISMLQRPRAAP